MVHARGAGRSSRRWARWAALREPGPYLVPTFGTMCRVLADTVRAPATLVSTVPPVEPSGSVMLVPFLDRLPRRHARRLARPRDDPAARARRSRGARPGGDDPARRAGADAAGARAACSSAGRPGLGGRARPARREARVERRRGSVRGRRRPSSTVALRVGPGRACSSPTTTSPTGCCSAGDGDTARRQRARDAPVPAGAAGTTSGCFRAKGVPDGAPDPVRRARPVRRRGLGARRGVPGHGGLRHLQAHRARTCARCTRAARRWSEVQILPGYASDWLPMLGELTSIDLEFNPGRTQVERRPLQPGDVERPGHRGSGPPRRLHLRVGARAARSSAGATRTREPTDEQRQPRGAFLDDVPRALRPRRAARRSSGCCCSRATCGPTAPCGSTGVLARRPDDLGRRMLGSADMAATPFQYSALDGARASRLGVAARVVTGAEPGPRGLVDVRRRHLVGRAPVRRRHVAHPRARRATSAPASPSRTRPALAARCRATSSRTRSLGAARRQGPRDPAPGRVRRNPDGTAKAGDRAPALAGGRSALLRPAVGWRSSRSCCVPLAKAAAARAPSSYVVVVRALRQRLAGGARRRARPGDPRARTRGAGWPRHAPRASGSTWPAGPTRRCSPRRRPPTRTARSSGTTCQRLRRELLAEQRRARSPLLGAASTPPRCSPGWARRRARPLSAPSASAPRRSPCRGSAARGRVTTRPTRGRAARATRARRGRPARSRAACSRRTQSPSVRWCST